MKSDLEGGKGGGGVKVSMPRLTPFYQNIANTTLQTCTCSPPTYSTSIPAFEVIPLHHRDWLQTLKCTSFHRWSDIVSRDIRLDVMPNFGSRLQSTHFLYWHPRRQSGFSYRFFRLRNTKNYQNNTQHHGKVKNKAQATSLPGGERRGGEKAQDRPPRRHHTHRQPL